MAGKRPGSRRSEAISRLKTTSQTSIQRKQSLAVKTTLSRFKLNSRRKLKFSNRSEPNEQSHTHSLSHPHTNLKSLALNFKYKTFKLKSTSPKNNYILTQTSSNGVRIGAFWIKKLHGWVGGPLFHFVPRQIFDSKMISSNP